MKVTEKREARRLRELTRDESRQKAKVTYEHMARVLDMARKVIADNEFADILRSQGIKSVPRFLAANTNPVHGDKSIPGSNTECSGDKSLDFVIAWTFFYPLLAIPAIAAYLEKAWPAFVLELKDAFISLVVDGPFPQFAGQRRGRPSCTAENR